MSFDDLCSLLDPFGLACLTVRTPDGLVSRPLVPVVDRKGQELTAVVEEDWLRTYGGREISAQLVFVSEITHRCLAIRGTVRRSLQPRDIASSWSALARAWFPDGPGQPGIIALRFAPASAELWDVRTLEAQKRWLSQGAG